MNKQLMFRIVDLTTNKKKVERFIEDTTVEWDVFYAYKEAAKQCEGFKENTSMCFEYKNVDNHTILVYLMYL